MKLLLYKLLEKTMSAVLPVYPRCELMFERGEGAYLFATNGKRYLDFTSGIAVDCLGHAHPHLVEAMQDQAAKLWHVSNLFKIEGLEELAQRLADNSFAEKAFFCNSGAEAVECAIKMVRKYHYENGDHKYRIITFEGCFHGRTMATISASQKPKVMEGFAPAMDGFDVVPFNDLEAVKNAIGPQTGGVMLEPIIGEGGIKSVDQAFLKGLRALCDEKGLLLVLDEIQTGYGRTGKFFAHEHYGITPDIMSVAKGIGGGFPMGACLSTNEAGKGMTAGTHGTTYGGNPMAMRIGNAVLDIVLADGFLDNVTKLGSYIKTKTEEAVAEFPNILIEPRGIGLMAGVQVNEDVMEAREFVSELRKKGLLTVPAAENVVRLYPPLNITEAEIDEAMKIVKELCKELKSND
jgi:acetylornithine/N-succinyldiaminopimelate aminotransferase